MTTEAKDLAINNAVNCDSIFCTCGCCGNFDPGSWALGRTAAVSCGLILIGFFLLQKTGRSLTDA